jgi:flagellar protein FlaJ
VRLLAAIVINTYLMGLVAGKVSSGTLAAGFKHALLLTFFTLLMLLAAPLFNVALGGLAKPVT